MEKLKDVYEKELHFGQNEIIKEDLNSLNSLNKCESHKKMSAGGDVVTMNGCCNLDLNVDDKIRMVIADIGNTGTGNYYSSELNMYRIGN